MPLKCAKWPMPAVIAMPRQPPIITRMVGFKTAAPEERALIKPVAKSPRSVKPTMLTATAPAVGANAPANGIRPPNVKLSADATAA